MKSQAFKILMTLVLLVPFFGCAAGLTDYKPNSPDETSVKDLFVSMEKAWNDKDVKRVLAVYHEDAKIMEGKEQQILSKKKYDELLRDEKKGLKNSGTIKCGTPKIKISQDGTKAVTDIDMIYSQYNVVLHTTFSLIRDGDNWLITSRTYTY
jgi:ketosteroid isomerase-like protein